MPPPTTAAEQGFTIASLLAVEGLRRGAHGNGRSGGSVPCITPSFYGAPVRRTSVVVTEIGDPIGSSAVTDLSGIVKAYDVRGVVGEELDDAVVRDIGAAL